MSFQSSLSGFAARIPIVITTSISGIACGSDVPQECGVASIGSSDARDATSDADVGGADPDAVAAPGDTELTCAWVSCGAAGRCDGASGTCACPPGTWFDGAGCRAVGACDDLCRTCPVPGVAAVSPIASSETLIFDAGDLPIEVAVVDAGDTSPPATWDQTDRIALDVFAGRTIRVLARVASDACAEGPVAHLVLQVTEGYPGPAGTSTSVAVPGDDPRVSAWATEVVSYRPGDGVTEEFAEPERSLGPAEGNSIDVVSLGIGGEIVVAFADPVNDVPGWDLAVFENSFSDAFLELAFVEVSSDGAHFAAFDVANLTDAPVGAFGALDPSQIGQLAGTVRQGYGTPFDLSLLRQAPEVQSGTVDLTEIRFVRVTDVGGDGRARDSFGRPIFAPYPTAGSAGFDLDAVAALSSP